jgi:hypothetical protein
MVDAVWAWQMTCPLPIAQGLGKTFQSIAFLAHVKSLGDPGPHLVICPASTVGTCVCVAKENDGPGVKAQAIGQCVCAEPVWIHVGYITLQWVQNNDHFP